MIFAESYLTGGALKHTSNTKIAANLNPSELEELKTDLEFLRQDYLLQETEARKAYERIKVRFQLAQKKVSNDCRIIRGILDPRAEELWILVLFLKSQKLLNES